MSALVRTVFGMPAYNRPDTLARTLESLLGQTRRDFAIVIVDDKPSPEVQAIVERYQHEGVPLIYEPNPVRLGMIGNWHKAFTRAQALFPESAYFAWVSDHDVWHPRWLEVLAGELDANPRLVLAYPQMQRVFTTHRRVILRRFDCTGVTDPLERVRQGAGAMTAGNCIYALFRSATLAQAGVFRPVLAPDRQVLLQLLLLGEFRHVPEVLWYREVAGNFSYSRQRAMFFPTYVPWHTYLPATLQHWAAVFWSFGILGRGRPQIGRLRGMGYACAQYWLAVKRELFRKDAHWREALERSALGRRLFRERDDKDTTATPEPGEAGDTA